MNMAQGLVGGATIYENQTLEMMIEDLDNFLAFSNEALEFEDQVIRIENAFDFRSTCAEILFFAKRYKEFYENNIHKIKQEDLDKYVTKSLIEFGINASKLNIEIGKIWHQETHSDSQQKYSTIYAELRDYVITLQDSNNIGWTLDKRYFDGDTLINKKAEKKNFIYWVKESFKYLIGGGVIKLLIDLFK